MSNLISHICNKIRYYYMQTKINVMQFHLRVSLIKLSSFKLGKHRINLYLTIYFSVSKKGGAN